MRTTKKLYQWDTDQKLVDCVGKYVDYPIGDEVYRIEVIDKECIIPDELLQVSGTVKVYECMEYGTVKAFAFYINPRPKPPDYVFTPTQRLTFEGLVKKVDETIADLQKRAASGEFNGSDYVITESDYDAIAAKTAGKLQPTIGELARTLETEKTDREQADKDIQKGISGKLSEPVEGLAVGKYFRVAQIDENGHAVLEAVDAKTIGVQDVRINSESIIANGIANIDITNSSGLKYDDIYGLRTAQSSNTQIDSRSNKQQPITPNNIDYAVKASMCDGKGAAWTADEQAAARKRMGIQYVGEWEDIVTVTIEEAVSSFTVDKDANGNPFSLTHVICEFIMSIEDAAKSRNVYFGSDSAIGPTTSFFRIPVASSVAAKTEVVAYAKIISGKIYCDGGIATAIPNNYQPSQKYGIVNGYCMLSAESFNRIFVITYNDAFPAGSQLIIRGIRK